MDNKTSLHDTADILGVPVCKMTTTEFARWVINRMETPASAATFVTYLNAACSNIAADDSAYSQILNDVDCVYADGQAIVWAAGLLGDPLPERVNAGDFIVDFCREVAARDLSIALVGGRPGVAEQAARHWKSHVPVLKIAGAWDGFFGDNSASVVQAVASTRPDIVLVGMGAPLQEKWAWECRDRLGAPVVWCVGALFEYYGENRPRAPIWMRRAGLEWLFRLVLEPRRLWKRYLVGNIRFVWRVFRARN